MQKDSSKLFELNGKMPPLSYAMPMAVQHLVAMIVGCVTPAIIIGNMAGLGLEQKVLLVQSSLVIAAVSTFLQLFPIFRMIGAGLPMMMGVSFAYISSMQAIVAGYGLAEIFGAQLIGGIIAVVIGFFAPRLSRFFPPLITGTVVFTIGLSLYPTAINYMAGGAGSATYGSFLNWGIALLTLAVVTVCNHFGKGLLKLASILVGIAVGYLVSLCFNMVSFDSISQAGFFALPKIAPFGIKFEVSSVMAFSLLFAINSIQAIGDMSATSISGLDREPSGHELRGGIIGFGVGNIIGSLFGGLPVATYSQNVGIVSTTKVVNRRVLGITAAMLLVAGLVPKFSAVLTTIPQCVLGGATISVFASIAMTGMKLVVSQPMNYRNTSIVGLSAALGVGISQVSDSLQQFPDWVTMVFAKSPVVLATLVAVFLNLILPRNE
jgi:xanthine permease